MMTHFHCGLYQYQILDKGGDFCICSLCTQFNHACAIITAPNLAYSACNCIDRVVSIIVWTLFFISFSRCNCLTHRMCRKELIYDMYIGCIMEIWAYVMSCLTIAGTQWACRGGGGGGASLL